MIRKVYIILFFINSLLADSLSYKFLDNNEFNIKEKILNKTTDIFQSYNDYDADKLYKSLYNPTSINASFIFNLLKYRFSQCENELEENSFIRKTFRLKYMSSKMRKTSNEFNINFDKNIFNKEFGYLLYICNATFDKLKLRKNEIVISDIKETKFSYIATVNFRDDIVKIKYDKFLGDIFFSYDNKYIINFLNKKI